MDIRQHLLNGVAIPAHPLAINANRKLDERRQRALTRYYLDSGVGGIAVGVHTTQFAIRDPRFGLLRPVLELAAEEISSSVQPIVRIGGICGATNQAVQEAELLRDLNYDAGLLSMASLKHASVPELLAHAQTVAQILPIVGFYLQPSVGGRLLTYEFWRRFAEIENVVAIKIAPFNRYQTLDVLRGVADSGREDIALYTGNDDHIVGDLVTRFQSQGKSLRIVGGLLGHWAVWTRRATRLLSRCHNEGASADLLQIGVEVTDCNAAFFDAANGFHGCIAGIHEVLRRNGLLEGIWCLDERETLSPGQYQEIDRVCRTYPHLHDDEFIRENLDRWLS